MSQKSEVSARPPAVPSAGRAVARPGSEGQVVVREVEPAAWLSRSWSVGAGLVGGLLSGAALAGVAGVSALSLPLLGLSALLGVLALVSATGFYTVATNKAVNLTVFGVYAGTDRSEGLRWMFPIGTGKTSYTLAVMNMVAPPVKANDKGGSPIELGGTVVWRVTNPAMAQFSVANCVEFVKNQLDIALRETAGAYRYDTTNEDEDGEVTLRGHVEEVTKRLRDELSERCSVAGVDIVDFRLTTLAYAPEIARDMLRRQQAEAVLAARAAIARGAAGIVSEVVDAVEKKVELDARERAALVSNLLVVMVGDGGAQPVMPMRGSQGG